MFTPLQIEIIKALQNDLPLVPKPYEAIAQTLGISEEALLGEIRTLQEMGALKRISIALRHNNVGYTINAMIVWDVPEERVAAAGEALAKHERVTHCYDRNKAEDFDYNLYSMVHAMNEKEYQDLVEELKQIVQPIKFAELKTLAELKKIGMKYFMEED